jgi:hypothetical protein
VELIGPSAVCLLRRVRWAARPDVGYDVQAAEQAQSLGLGHGGARAPLWRTLSRLARASDFTRANHDRLLAPSDPIA